jgi:glycosyltransferase involved in cell wall biosynthesis
MTTLSLIIPCFNEAENLSLLLESCLPLGINEDIEVIIVNNGSTDNTAKILENLLPKYSFCKLLHVPVNQGYGYGILQGLKAAKGDILGWTHADLQTDPNDVLIGLRIFLQNGSQSFVKGRRIKRAFIDSFFTLGMSIFEICIFRKVLWDINAQPNLFSREFYETWNNPPHDYSLDLYVYLMAMKSGLKAYRFPVYFKKRSYGSSHWNTNWLAKIKFIYSIMVYSLMLKMRKIN